MPIKVDKVDDGLPISVLVPLSHKRKEFFNNIVLPLIEANNPNEIIINDNIGSQPKKLNDCFKKSTQPYIFCCDDDIVLQGNHIVRLFEALQKNKTVDFTYTGYEGIVLHPETHPVGGNFKIHPIPFNIDILKRGNYISTMSLVCRESFLMFDETLKRFIDWDLWLRIVEQGGRGMLVPNLTFFAFYLDEGVTSKHNSEQDAVNVIRKKHNL